MNGRELTDLEIFCAGHAHRLRQVTHILCVYLAVCMGILNWDCPVCGSQVADVYQNRFLENWQEISRIRKPIIAAVSGYAVSSLQKKFQRPYTHFDPLSPCCPTVRPSYRLMCVRNAARRRV